MSDNLLWAELYPQNSHDKGVISELCGDKVFYRGDQVKMRLLGWGPNTRRPVSLKEEEETPGVHAMTGPSEEAARGLLSASLGEREAVENTNPANTLILHFKAP